MRSLRVTSAALLLFFLAQAAPSFPVVAASEPYIERHFEAPIDYFSVKMQSTSFEYAYKDSSGWSKWKTYEDDGDALGDSPESELLTVPYGVVALRVRDIEKSADIHPIVVSHEPVQYPVAAAGSFSGRPFILSRSDWGADESYLYPSETSPVEAPSAEKGDNGGTAASAGRLNDCEQAHTDYPAEFKVASTVTKDAQGRSYAWPIQYSPEVRLLTVHHSALLIQGDPRPAVERVRALYKYHAQNRGWGDIGYHYVIDESGQVYEGRQGGKFVVGGHAYCNNVGTVGVVLLGNFEMEQPSQKQVASLQHLLSNLAIDYKIDLKRSVQFHGKTFDTPIVRHRDLLSTLCPGYYLSEAFGQIVKNVREGKLDAVVQFPVITKQNSVQSILPTTAAGLAPGVTFTGRSSIVINPGGKQRLSFSYTADKAGAYEGKKVAEVRLSDPDIRLFVDNGRAWIPVTTGILLSSDVPASETVTLQLIVQAPMQAGNYALDIAGMRFTLFVSGRRARTGTFINPFYGNQSLIVEPVKPRQSTTVTSRIRPQTRLSMQSSSSARSVSASLGSSLPSDAIRIRLSASAQPVITFSEQGRVDGTPIRTGTSVELLSRGGECVALSRGATLTSAPVLRFESDVSGVLAVAGINAKNRSYRGVLECRIVGGKLALINELSLEDYLVGLAEEPDSEPYEKQRAFAIAARTYAAFYMDHANRKFPGMPYDGSDDPAIFQAYAGVDFEGANPNWVRAAKDTANEVLTFDGKIIKPPYFSSDNGQTKTPEQAGWKNFPFAHIFSSKADPWCKGLPMRGHGVGMSGCGALGQAKEGRSAEQILQYYYPGTRITGL